MHHDEEPILLPNIESRHDERYRISVACWSVMDERRLISYFSGGLDQKLVASIVQLLE